MKDLPDDWWPDFIDPIDDRVVDHGEYLSVAEIVEPRGAGTYRQIFTALAPTAAAEAILQTSDSIGYEVSASGPHPSVHEEGGPPEYQPEFWIFGGDAAPAGLEPLVVSWTSANMTVLRVDQGFLMTYGLIPRVVRTQADEIHEHWDDNETPRMDIVVSKPMSVFSFPSPSPAWVRVRREYLVDYAFLRDRYLLTVVYGHATGFPADKDLQMLRKTGRDQFLSEGRKVQARFVDNSGKLHVRYWVARELLRPRNSPITAGRWDYGELLWPGIPQPLTGRGTFPIMDFVYVKDSVLGPYEGRANEGFEICPECGGVSHYNQWSVGYIQRIGRDLLQLEVRKLYEGCPPPVVHHWHAHAVPPPKERDKLRGLPNVATRARRIVLGTLAVGEAIAELGSMALGRPLISANAVGLDRGALEYRGWWTQEDVEPIARHLPIDLPEHRFLDRMTDITKVVVEALREPLLRELVTALGYDTETTKDFGTLRLLECLVRHCEIASRTGLNATLHAAVIASRCREADSSPAVGALKALHALRTLDAHRANHSKGSKMKTALATFQIPPESTASGWGTAADKVYDKLGAALELLAQTIRQAAHA